LNSHAGRHRARPNNVAGRSAAYGRNSSILFTDDLIPSLFGQPVFGR
jgi:hypothetical protein